MDVTFCKKCIGKIHNRMKKKKINVQPEMYWYPKAASTDNSLKIVRTLT